MAANCAFFDENKKRRQSLSQGPGCLPSSVNLALQMLNQGEFRHLVQLRLCPRIGIRQLLTAQAGPDVLGRRFLCQTQGLGDIN